jgi:hypothetical protein
MTKKQNGRYLRLLPAMNGWLSTLGNSRAKQGELICQNRA